MGQKRQLISTSAAKTKNGENDLKRAELLADTEKFKQAIAGFNTALEKGSLKDPGKAHFRKGLSYLGLKQYNSAFSFVSYGSDCFAEVDSSRGPPITICHGTVYHNSGFLFPDEGQPAQYAQVYLYDHNEALQTRQENSYNAGLSRDVLNS